MVRNLKALFQRAKHQNNQVRTTLVFLPLLGSARTNIDKGTTLADMREDRG
jgi:hypothetical protein